MEFIVAFLLVSTFLFFLANYILIHLATVILYIIAAIILLINALWNLMINYFNIDIEYMIKSYDYHLIKFCRDNETYMDKQTVSIKDNIVCIKKTDGTIIGYETLHDILITESITTKIGGYRISEREFGLFEKWNEVNNK